MDTIGLDLHKRETQLCILTEEGELVERRLVTSRERFTAVLGGRPQARILLEASTESEWVARHLEALGHEVIVADPNFAPMYATRRRGVKTDRRDARTLAEACRLGAYRRAHRASDGQRHVRAELAVRDALIRTRTRYVALTKALVRQDGLRLPSGGPEHTDAKLAALPLPPALAAELAPLRALWEPVNTQITAADARLAHVAAGDPVVAQSMTAPAIGPVTAVAFVATLDEVTQFASAHQVAAYLGLTPREYSSGEQQRRGRISKTGNVRMRSLLVEAAWHVLRTKDPAAAPLRAWADQIAQRRGRSIAAVALARRLAGILYAMWRDRTDYRAPRRSAVEAA
ncbi:MAG: IS110 family transposase [Candidatus Methylomirabilaceae bacterium]